MILYFNDYKLIYIITMMGKINNIPVFVPCKFTHLIFM